MPWAGNGSWSPKGDLGLLGDLFLKTGLLLVSFLSKSLLLVENYLNTVHLRVSVRIGGGKNMELKFFKL